MDFIEFEKKIEKELLNHPIIERNDYTQWFSKGNLTHGELEHFTVQFSVFSNLFLVAQLKKMIHSHSLDMMRSSKEILASEIGVTFKGGRNSAIETKDFTLHSQGSIEGGVFHFRAGHFEWLLDFAKPLGLGFKDLGKRSLGTRETLFFTDTLDELFSDEDPSISLGASFAIENWANRGFWKELISGLKKWNSTNKKLPLGFFIWHDKVEDQHAEHTQEELKELFSSINLNEEKFIASGNRALDALKIFWDGMFLKEEMRKIS